MILKDIWDRREELKEVADDFFKKAQMPYNEENLYQWLEEKTDLTREQAVWIGEQIGANNHELMRSPVQKPMLFGDLKYNECDTEYYRLMCWALDSTLKKQYKRPPNILWRFRVPDGRLELRPKYTAVVHKIRQWNDEDLTFDEFFIKIESGDWVSPHNECNYYYEDEIGLRLVINEKHYCGYFDLYDSIALRTFEQEHVDIVVDTLNQLLEDPTQVTCTERSRCCFCQRPLKDPKSVERGFGPDCGRAFRLL